MKVYSTSKGIGAGSSIKVACARSVKNLLSIKTNNSVCVDNIKKISIFIDNSLLIDDDLIGDIMLVTGGSRNLKRDRLLSASKEKGEVKYKIKMIDGSKYEC